MKIEITRELKIRLLQAIQDGIFDTDKFPELASSTIVWNEVRNYEAPEKEEGVRPE